MTERVSEPVPTSFGQYAIRARIGSGGMGDVYDAMHTTLNRRVAIKTLRRRYLEDETVVARFLREGQLASRIRHPNIVDVTDVGMIGGLPCLVMEHLEGEPLSALVKRSGPMPVEVFVDLLLPIVGAVEYAHARGVLHRDLKPSNIFLARSWNGEQVPKVLDFGISKLLDESQQAALTVDASFVGTPHYASPEAMRAEKATDGRSDQYSLGVVLYECATGKKPYADKGGNFIALAMAICEGDFPRPRTIVPALPAELETVIVRAMALRGQDRFPSVRALGAALLPFASERARLIWAPTFMAEDQAAALGETASPPVTFGPTSRGSSSLGSSERTPSFAVQESLPAGPHPSAGFSKRTQIGILVALGAMLATGVTALVLVARAKAAHASREDSPPPVVVAAGTFALQVSATPASAVFELDGAPLGAGPISRDLPADGRSHVLRVSAPGFETFFTPFDQARLPPPVIVLRAIDQAPSKAHGVETSPAQGGGRSGGNAKNTDKRPRTDNIDPWQ